MIIKFNNNFRIQILNDMSNKWSQPFYIGTGYLNIDKLDLEEIDKTMTRLMLKYTIK